MQHAKTVRREYKKFRRPRVSAGSTLSEFRPAGHYVASELKERGLCVRWLANEMRYPIGTVEAILRGSLLTADDVGRLATALRTSTEIWADLDREWRAHLLSRKW